MTQVTVARPASDARYVAGRSETPDPARLRLMEGLASALTDKGYAATTIADIVAHARVSKRTFYEHFTDKEDCLVAVYELACSRLVDVLRDAPVDGQAWQDRVRATVAAYLSAIEATPTLTRTLLLEIQAAGARAFRVRNRMQRRFADVLCELVEQGRVDNPEVRPLSPALALAIVGGVNELLLHAVDPYPSDDGPAPPPDPEHPFTSLTEAVTELVSAVLSHHIG
ncbi:MAG TPA: TetR/AcrR family transcriptional regulator [Micromonosporaceae bacterium]